MAKEDVIAMINAYMNSRDLIDPVELLQWTWLRMIITQIPDNEWKCYVEKAIEIIAAPTTHSAVA
jgi:hypothetical protein